jgi:DNA-binding winged helix-turn-helix (wHTH) protein
MRLDLGPVTLDTDRHQVYRDNKPVHLTKKAYQLLELLLENRPRALSKQEIQDALWPKTFVSDTSLTTLVNEIRTLLSETAREPRFIRTVHGYGYAFEGTAPPSTASRCRLVWGEREVPLDEGENILGRDRAARGSIPDSSLSRRHARITVRGDAATLEDLSSKNGTFVGEKRVTAPVHLSDGDTVRLGLVRLVFRAAPGSFSTTTKTAR